MIRYFVIPFLFIMPYFLVENHLLVELWSEPIEFTESKSGVGPPSSDFFLLVFLIALSAFVVLIINVLIVRVVISIVNIKRIFYLSFMCLILGYILALANYSSNTLYLFNLLFSFLLLFIVQLLFHQTNKK